MRQNAPLADFDLIFGKKEDLILIWYIPQLRLCYNNQDVAL